MRDGMRIIPSVFGISVVFGGGAGMSAASAFGLDAGGGFIAGAFLVFLVLSVAVILSRELIAAMGDLIVPLEDDPPRIGPKSRR